MGGSESISAPRQVYCELQTLRQMGIDLTDPDAVVSGLDAYNFETTLEWVLHNPDDYERAIREGLNDETTAGRSA